MALLTTSFRHCRAAGTRSVVVRHLQQLADAGIVRADKEGRHVFYQLNASAVRQRVEGILATTKLLEATIGADLCKLVKPGS